MTALHAITPQEALQRVIEHREIFHDEMLHIMRLIMGGEMSPVLMAAFISALRVKKETIGEITAAAQVMREFSTKVQVADTQHMVDIVGTGGDGSHTFNISTCSMFVVAAAGAKVLHLRCVEYAKRFDLPIHVRSSFSEKEGTFVIADLADQSKLKKLSKLGAIMEQPIIAGVAHDLGDAKITVVGVPDRPGMAAAIFQAVADAGINMDMIVQNVSVHGSGATDVTFTCPRGDSAKAELALRRIEKVVEFKDIDTDDNIGKISLVGAGMRSHPGVSATFFKAIADAGVNVEMISTSEIRISVVTRAQDAEKAVKAIHTAFGLDVDGEAVVYGGTGR
jgi:aspartate kinase